MPNEKGEGKHLDGNNPVQRSWPEGGGKMRKHIGMTQVYKGKVVKIRGIGGKGEKVTKYFLDRKTSYALGGARFGDNH